MSVKRRPAARKPSSHGALEKSIGGDGYRTPLNTYMFADANAISIIAYETLNRELGDEFHAKASELQHLVTSKLWNPKDQFFEDLSPAADSGIRKQKKFMDPGTQLKLAGVRELIGYLPWAYSSPARDHDIAWRQLFDSQGFDGKFGATTAERRSPRFRYCAAYSSISLPGWRQCLHSADADDEYP